MKIYIDLFLIFNIFMDIIITMGVSSLLRRNTNMFRIVISSFLGGISSLLVLININRILIQIISIVLMCLISFGYRNIRYTIKNIFYMYLISVIIGGIIYLFNIKIDNGFLYYLVIAIIGLEVTILYIKEMKKIKDNYNNYYHVDIYFSERKISLVGFVDTGNNLYDPYKKRPIIIMQGKYEGDDKYIIVPYHTVLGEGIIKCVKPKCVCINGNTIHNVLVGFSDNIKFIDGVDVILHKDVMRGE